jgi:hypothetical protein
MAGGDSAFGERRESAGKDAGNGLSSGPLRSVKKPTAQSWGQTYGQAPDQALVLHPLDELRWGGGDTRSRRLPGAVPVLFVFNCKMAALMGVPRSACRRGGTMQWAMRACGGSGPAETGLAAGRGGGGQCARLAGTGRGVGASAGHTGWRRA